MTREPLKTVLKPIGAGVLLSRLLKRSRQRQANEESQKVAASPRAKFCSAFVAWRRIYVACYQKTRSTGNAGFLGMFTRTLFAKLAA